MEKGYFYLLNHNIICIIYLRFCGVALLVTFIGYLGVWAEKIGKFPVGSLPMNNTPRVEMSKSFLCQLDRYISLPSLS